MNMTPAEPEPDGVGVDPAADDAVAPAPEATDAQAVVDGHAGHLVVTPEGDPVPPTQVRRPWRATVRTVVQATLALATLLPFVVTGVYGNDGDIPAAVTQVLVVAGVLTRIMAMPQVEKFLADFLPFLAAVPKETDA